LKALEHSSNRVVGAEAIPNLPASIQPAPDSMFSGPEASMLNLS
jgi:hypothetical protein